MKMIFKRPILSFLLFALAASAGATEPGSATARDRKIVREGISIELEMEGVKPQVQDRDELREGDTVTFRFRITDTNTDTPLSGVYPAAWMDRRLKGETVPSLEACQDKVEAFIGGSLFSDAMGDPDTPEGNYIGMVRHNIDTIVNALLGE